MSHDIQNECLKIMALHIVRDIAKSIRESACFAIMADECTDLANKEQFTICIRWVSHDLKDYEHNVAGLSLYLLPFRYHLLHHTGS